MVEQGTLNPLILVRAQALQPEYGCVGERLKPPAWKAGNPERGVRRFESCRIRQIEG